MNNEIEYMKNLRIDLISEIEDCKTKVKEKEDELENLNTKILKCKNMKHMYLLLCNEHSVILGTGKYVSLPMDILDFTDRKNAYKFSSEDAISFLINELKHHRSCNRNFEYELCNKN